MANKKLTARQMRAAIGCKVMYRGNDATIIRAERLQQWMWLILWDGGSAIIKPSELA